MSDYEPPGDAPQTGGQGQPTVVPLTGAALQAALNALPTGVAADVTTVVAIRTAGPQDADQVEQISYWACTDGHITVHVGHTDPVGMTSVYDGSVSTTIPCGG
jgi:hypothetical protein